MPIITANREVRLARLAYAEAVARIVLQPGDRIRASRGCAPPATYTFAGWDGHWIVSRSGFDDIHALHVTRVNGRPVCLAPAPEVPDE